MQAEPPTSISGPSRPPRFSWPMRLFLTLVVFDMIFHSAVEALTCVTPYTDWLREFGVPRYPTPLPSAKEMAQLRAKAQPGQPDPIDERLRKTLDSFPEYLNPWPTDEVRARLENTSDWGRYAVAWLASRLDLFEGLFGLEQEWTMFAPNVSRTATLTRLRLFYDDGTTLDLRLWCDPPDLTQYSRWFLVKVLDSERHVSYDQDCRLGYCHFVHHRYAQSATGAAMKAIYLYKVHYAYPEPGADAFAVLAAQNGPPQWDEAGPRWEYDANDGRLYSLNPEVGAAMQEKLAPAPSLGEAVPSYP